jgi:drug/metabolite transporter (DMT)-like permease
MSPVLVLIIAVLATTYAGPVVRLATAPAIAIAFWRLTMVLPVTGTLATREPRAPVRSSLGLMILSGILLAAHFWTWIASLRFTSVASSVVLVSLKPIFVWGIAAVWLDEHPSRREKWGILLAVIGAILIGASRVR